MQTHYKAIFSDIDGTLITSDHKISPKTELAIKNVLAKGLPFIPVSARPPLAITPYMDQLGNKSATICFSGALILNADLEPLYNVVIEKADQIALDEVLKDYQHMGINHYVQSEWYSNDPNLPSVQREERITQLKSVKKPDELIQANKVLIMGEASEILALETKLKVQFPQLSIHRSLPEYLEIMHKSATKANAIRFMESILAVKGEEVIAFGDNFNDLDMLEYAGLSVAMGNAPDEIKRVAKRVTLSNNEDGIAIVLNELF